MSQVCVRARSRGSLLAFAIIGGAVALAAAAPWAEAEPRALGVSASPRVTDIDTPFAKRRGSYKLGLPYRVGGHWYVPKHEPRYNRVGVASWYGADFNGRLTANGEVFDMEGLTAAHPTLPLPCHAYVTNLDNGRTILVRINDRGPYHGDRLIDLSRKSAALLGFEDRGTANVRVAYAGHAPLDGDDAREQLHLKAQAWYVPEPEVSLLPFVVTSPTQQLKQLAEPQKSPAGRGARKARYFVDAGLHNDRTRAERAARLYATLGPAIIESEGDRYRVLLGPFDAATAESKALSIAIIASSTR